MATDITNKTFNFKHRGRQVVEWIDLFDECRYGAEKLFFRGRFETISEVAEQIAASLSDKFKEQGSGNPVAQDKQGESGTIYAEGIALHRYRVPDKQLWTPIDFKDKYPYKARYAVEYLLRLKFYEDYGYIKVGVPWEKLYNEDGKLNEKYPIDPSYVSNGFSLEDIRPLCWWEISKKDVNVVMGGMRYTDEEGNEHAAQPTDDGYEVPEEYREIIENANVIGNDEKQNADFNITAFITQQDENIFMVSQDEKDNIEP